MSNRMIKVFPAENMRWTPFQNDEKRQSLLVNEGLVFTEQVRESDVVVAGRLEPLQPYIRKFGRTKSYLIWSNEPRGYISFQKTIVYKGATVHVMSAYTGDCWLNNLQLFRPKVWLENPHPLGTQSGFSRLKGKKIVALLAYRPHEKEWSLMRDGKNIDLSVKRTQLALRGHELGKADVFGNGWPDGIVCEDSRTISGWHDRKQVILRDYSFNVAMENTNVPYYCTEKIWDSILAGCLPIYWGKGNNIYEDFPPNSFLDYADFDSPEALFEYIDAMTFAEFRERFDRCAEVCNAIAKKYPTPQEMMVLKNRRNDQLMEKLEMIMESKSPEEAGPGILNRFWQAIRGNA